MHDGTESVLDGGSVVDGVDKDAVEDESAPSGEGGGGDNTPAPLNQNEEGEEEEEEEEATAPPAAPNCEAAPEQAPADEAFADATPGPSAVSLDTNALPASAPCAENGVNELKTSDGDDLSADEHPAAATLDLPHAVLPVQHAELVSGGGGGGTEQDDSGEDVSKKEREEEEEEVEEEEEEEEEVVFDAPQPAVPELTPVPALLQQTTFADEDGVGLGAQGQGGRGRESAEAVDGGGGGGAEGGGGGGGGGGSLRGAARMDRLRAEGFLHYVAPEQLDELELSAAAAASDLAAVIGSLNGSLHTAGHSTDELMSMYQEGTDSTLAEVDRSVACMRSLMAKTMQLNMEMKQTQQIAAKVRRMKSQIVMLEAAVYTALDLGKPPPVGPSNT